MKKIVIVLLLLWSSLFSFEHLTGDNMQTKVQKGEYIVDFYATWCPPCKIIDKNLKSFDQKNSEEITIFKVDIDQQKSLAKQYNIRSLPSLVYIKDGEVKGVEIGLRSVEQLGKDANKHFN